MGADGKIRRLPRGEPEPREPELEMPPIGGRIAQAGFARRSSSYRLESPQMGKDGARRCCHQCPVSLRPQGIRHRARQTKGSGSRLATLAMMFKLGRECEKGWRRLNGREQIQKLIVGIRFIDGVEEKAA